MALFYRLGYKEVSEGMTHEMIGYLMLVEALVLLYLEMRVSDLLEKVADTVSKDGPKGDGAPASGPVPWQRHGNDRTCCIHENEGCHGCGVCTRASLESEHGCKRRSRGTRAFRGALHVPVFAVMVCGVPLASGVYYRCPADISSPGTGCLRRCAKASTISRVSSSATRGPASCSIHRLMHRGGRSLPEANRRGPAIRSGSIFPPPATSAAAQAWSSTSRRSPMPRRLSRCPSALSRRRSTCRRRRPYGGKPWKVPVNVYYFERDVIKILVVNYYCGSWDYSNDRTTIRLKPNLPGSFFLQTKAPAAGEAEMSNFRENYQSNERFGRRWSPCRCLALRLRSTCC